MQSKELSPYNVPADWEAVHSRSEHAGDFEGDPPVTTGLLIGWKTPEGFVSPDKLPEDYRVKPDPRCLDADGSGKLLPSEAAIKAYGRAYDHIPDVRKMVEEDDDQIYCPVCDDGPDHRIDCPVRLHQQNAELAARVAELEEALRGSLQRLEVEARCGHRKKLTPAMDILLQALSNSNTSPILEVLKAVHYDYVTYGNNALCRRSREAYEALPASLRQGLGV